jgi:hypothetical protein
VWATSTFSEVEGRSKSWSVSTTLPGSTSRETAQWFTQSMSGGSWPALP